MSGVAAGVPIVCAVDERYLGPFCVLMQSLAAAHGAALDLRIVVLHRRLDDASRQRIHDHAARLKLQVELREVPGPPVPYPVLRWATDAMYLRLAIPEVVADGDVVLYLDADTVALRDLRPLLGTALAGAPLAAARDEQNPVLRGWPPCPRSQPLMAQGQVSGAGGKSRRLRTPTRGAGRTGHELLPGATLDDSPCRAVDFQAHRSSHCVTIR